MVRPITSSFISSLGQIDHFTCPRIQRKYMLGYSGWQSKAGVYFQLILENEGDLSELKLTELTQP